MKKILSAQFRLFQATETWPNFAEYGLEELLEIMRKAQKELSCQCKCCKLVISWKSVLQSGRPKLIFSVWQRELY
jgi:hypothetical protein